MNLTISDKKYLIGLIYADMKVLKELAAEDPGRWTADVLVAVSVLEKLEDKAI